MYEQGKCKKHDGKKNPDYISLEDTEYLFVYGSRVHNLQNIDVVIPVINWL